MSRVSRYFSDIEQVHLRAQQLKRERGEYVAPPRSHVGESIAFLVGALVWLVAVVKLAGAAFHAHLLLGVLFVLVGVCRC